MKANDLSILNDIFGVNGELRYYPDPLLLLKTEDFEIKKYSAETLKKILEVMESICIEEGGVALAANQIGINKSFFISDLGFVGNPKILERIGETSFIEGCLSFPDAHAKINRPKKIRMSWVDEDFKELEETISGEDCVICCHEYDHLLGKTFLDYCSPLKKSMILKKLKNYKRIVNKSKIQDEKNRRMEKKLNKKEIARFRGKKVELPEKFLETLDSFPKLPEDL